jgi:hypothetical protein
MRTIERLIERFDAATAMRCVEIWVSHLAECGGLR